MVHWILSLSFELAKYGRSCGAVHIFLTSITLNNIHCSAAIQASEATNIIGRFPGPQNAGKIVVTTPISGWFQCAGERAAGLPPQSSLQSFYRKILLSIFCLQAGMKSAFWVGTTFPKIILRHHAVYFISDHASPITTRNLPAYVLPARQHRIRS